MQCAISRHLFESLSWSVDSSPWKFSFDTVFDLWSRSTGYLRDLSAWPPSMGYVTDLGRMTYRLDELGIERESCLRTGRVTSRIRARGMCQLLLDTACDDLLLNMLYIV